MTNFESEQKTFQSPENDAEKELTPAERRHEIVDNIFDAEADKVPELMDEFVRSLALSADSGEITTSVDATIDSETGKTTPRALNAQELLLGKLKPALENRDKDPSATDSMLSIWDKTIPRVDGLRDDVKDMVNDLELGKVLSVELTAAIDRYAPSVEEAEGESTEDAVEEFESLSEEDRQMIERTYNRGLDLIRGDMGEALARAHNKLGENSESLVYSDRMIDDTVDELDQIQRRLTSGAQNLDAYGFSTLVGQVAEELNGRRADFARGTQSVEETKQALTLAPRGLTELTGAVESLDQAHRLELATRGDDPDTIEDRAKATLEQVIDAVTPNEALSADLTKLTAGGRMATGELGRAVSELDDVRQMILRSERVDLDTTMQIVGRLRAQLGSIDSTLGRKVYGGLEAYSEALKAQHRQLSGEQ